MENTISGAPSAHLGAHATRIPEQRPQRHHQKDQKDRHEQQEHPQDQRQDQQQGSPRAARPLLEAAVHYAERYRWEVAQGTWLEETGGAAPRCSCGDGACAAPGAHPAHPDWSSRATGVPAAVRRLWTERPSASVLLPTGRAFDAIEVPETAGFLALARMERLGITLGPVTLTPDGRTSFLVLPGGSGRVRRLVRELGWCPDSLDLRALGDGDHVVAPPTRFAARGAVQWVRRPGAGATGGAVPGAVSGLVSETVSGTVSENVSRPVSGNVPGAVSRGLPDAEDVLPSLAYACALDGRRA